MRICQRMSGWQLRITVAHSQLNAYVIRTRVSVGYWFRRNNRRHLGETRGDKETSERTEVQLQKIIVSRKHSRGRLGMHNTGKCASKTSGGIAQTLDRQIGHSLQGNVHWRFLRNRKGNKPADRVRCAGKCALKASGGIRQRLNRLMGHSTQRKVHWAHLKD